MEGAAMSGGSGQKEPVREAVWRLGKLGCGQEAHSVVGGDVLDGEPIAAQGDSGMEEGGDGGEESGAEQIGLRHLG